MAIKGYTLRTRDMYHPLYSTYQLDYLRPNVWEIVIGASSPDSWLTTSTTNSRSSSGGYASNSGVNAATRNATTGYGNEGHDYKINSFSSTSSGGLSLYCSNFSLNLPKSNTISVPWISGVTKLAGRNTEGFQISATFYAGLGSKSLKGIGDSNTSLGSLAVTDDVLRILYAWRNLCFDARTGQIGLAPSYKKPATLFMYDPSGVKIIYEFTVQGLWPSGIDAIQLDVTSDDIVKLQCTFEADFVYLEDDTKAMDDFFEINKADSIAGNSTKSMLYNTSGSLTGVANF